MPISPRAGEFLCMICDSGHWTLGNQAALRSVQHDMRRTALITVIALLLAACGAGPAGDGGISYDGAWQHCN